MTKTLENNLVNLFSSNRLSSYKYDINDTDSIALERYLFNIEVSKSLNIRYYQYLKYLCETG